MKFVGIIFMLAFFNSAVGQRCATEEYVTRSGSAEGKRIVMSGANDRQGRDTIADEVIVVPVVVHVLYNTNSQNISDERIIAQIEALNKDFRRMNADTVNTPVPFSKVAADTRIAFCLAKVDPDGYKTTGIIRKKTKESLFLADDQMKYTSKGGSDAWDASRYLNIWVCDLFGRTLGYATMPGGNPAVDGIVIKYGVFGYEDGLSAPYNKGRTLTHETGHWLGLKHIWGDMEGGTCASDDIDDTPPQTGSNSGCNAFPKLSGCSVDANGDMFMNYMDFSDDACMNLFTAGQKSRMRSQFARGGPRNSLLGLNLCDGSDAQAAPEVKEKTVNIRVYPNPVTDQVFIEAGKPDVAVNKMLYIYNAQGKLLIRRIIRNETESVSLGAFPQGMYVLVVGDGTGKRTFKVLKHPAGNKL